MRVEAALYATGGAPKALITVTNIPAKASRVSIYQAPYDNLNRDHHELIGQSAPSGGSAVFIDYFTDLNNAGYYLAKTDTGEEVEQYYFFDLPAKTGWLRDAHNPAGGSIILTPRGVATRPDESNFFAIDSASELSYEGNHEIVQVLGAKYPVMLGGGKQPLKFKLNIFLWNPLEINNAQALVQRAKILCVQLPSFGGWLLQRNIFTPVNASLNPDDRGRATLSLEVTPIARPRNIYQPDRLIGVFNKRPVTWGQAQANAQGYTIGDLKAFPTILLGDRPRPVQPYQ